MRRYSIVEDGVMECFSAGRTLLATLDSSGYLHTSRHTIPLVVPFVQVCHERNSGLFQIGFQVAAGSLHIFHLLVLRDNLRG